MSTVKEEARLAVQNLFQRPARAETLADRIENEKIGNQPADGVMLVRMNGTYYAVQATQENAAAQRDDYIPVNVNAEEGADLFIKSLAQAPEDKQYVFMGDRYVELHELSQALQAKLKRENTAPALEVVQAEGKNTFQMPQSYDHETGAASLKPEAVSVISLNNWKALEATRPSVPMVNVTANPNFDDNTAAMQATKNDKEATQYVPILVGNELYYARTVRPDEDYKNNPLLTFHDANGNSIPAPHDIISVTDANFSIKGSKTTPGGDFIPVTSPDGGKTYIPVIKASEEAQRALAQSGMHPLVWQDIQPGVEDGQLRLPMRDNKPQQPVAISAQMLPQLENGRILSSPSSTAPVHAAVLERDANIRQEKFNHTQPDGSTKEVISEYAVEENGRRKSWQSLAKKNDRGERSIDGFLRDGVLTLPENTRSVEVDYKTGTVNIGYGSSDVRIGNRYTFQLADIERISCENCSSLEIKSKGLPHSRTVNGTSVGRESPTFVNTEGLERMRLSGVRYSQSGVPLNLPTVEQGNPIVSEAFQDNFQMAARRAQRKAEREAEREYLADLRHSAYFARKALPYHRSMFMSDPTHHHESWQDSLNQNHQRHQNVLNFRQQMHFQREYSQNFGFAQNDNDNSRGNGYGNQNNYNNNGYQGFGYYGQNNNMPGMMQPYGGHGMYPTPYGYGQQQYANAMAYNNPMSQQSWQQANSGNFSLNPDFLSQRVTQAIRELERQGVLTVNNNEALVAAVGSNPQHGLDNTVRTTSLQGMGRKS